MGLTRRMGVMKGGKDMEGKKRRKKKKKMAHIEPAKDLETKPHYKNSHRIPVH